MFEVILPIFYTKFHSFKPFIRCLFILIYMYIFKHPGYRSYQLAEGANLSLKQCFASSSKQMAQYLCMQLLMVKTIDSNYYIENCLSQALDAIKGQRVSCGTKSIVLLNGNARCHTSKATNNFLVQQDIIMVKHPPYSPDLAPCDFWLFDYLIRNLDSYDNEKQLT